MREESVWKIITSETEKAYNIVSCSKNPIFAEKKYITLDKSGQGPLYIESKSENAIQDFYFFEIFET
jgi:hypothetical protein